MKNLIVFLACAVVPTVEAMSLLHETSLSTLLQTYSSDIQALQAIDSTADEVSLLRYCLEEPDDADQRMALMKENLAWKQGQGQALYAAAQSAVEQATKGGGWDNQAVMDNVPHKDPILKYLTADNCRTTTSSENDLVYCIRAGAIEDVALLEALQQNTKPLVDFFLYSKIVNSIVANQRSVAGDELVGIITVNDLKNVKLIGGSAEFRQALSESSKIATKLLPYSAGPTLLVNLPGLLNALVKLFTPLFPPAVAARLKFAQGPLRNIQSLADLTPDSAELAQLRKEIDSLVYQK